MGKYEGFINWFIDEPEMAAPLLAHLDREELASEVMERMDGLNDLWAQLAIELEEPLPDNVIPFRRPDHPF